MEELQCRKTSDRHSEEAFFRCAAVILPYLNPAELSSISSTCKTLHEISKAITGRRISDASRGLENLPIPFLKPSAAASEPYSYFIYTPTQTVRLSDDFRHPWGSDDDARLIARPDPFLFRVEGATGCNCPNLCGEHCPCSKPDESFLTRECGPSCECNSGCGNRVTQVGVTLRLKAVKDERKGWGLHAAEFISNGQFLDSVIIRSSGSLLPRVCLFASENIQENDELAFSYGDVRIKPNGQPCFCGSSSCIGILPSEDT